MTSSTDSKDKKVWKFIYVLIPIAIIIPLITLVYLVGVSHP